MKVFRSARLGGVGELALEDAPVPSPGPDEVVIALQAAGVNLADIAAASGERRPLPPTPFVPGLEGAGTIAAVGARVKGLKEGDVVAAFFPWGAFAQQAVTKAALVVLLPPGVTPQEAAMLPMAYAGARLALKDRARLAKGETVLVLGAGALGGLAAVEVANALGARVFAAASGATRGQPASAIADEVIDTGAAPLDQRVMALTDNAGADVIFDPVGGEAFEAASKACAVGGRFVCTGFASGRMPRVDLALLFARDAQLLTANIPQMVLADPARARAALKDVLEWAAQKKIRPRIAAKFHLRETAAALDYVRARRGHGGVIVTMKS